MPRHTALKVRDIIMYDIIIVGAGAAGMTAALNCRRAEKTVLVIEGENIGGQIAHSPKVENFPSVKQMAGSEFSDKLFDQITEWGADFEFDTVKAINKTAFGFKVQAEYGSYDGKSIILATGVKHRTMGIEREEELVGHGVSYCAICDGAFYAGEDVVMIGDANTALQYVNLLSGYCKSVHICTLFDRFFGDKVLIDSVLSKKNVTYTHNLALKRFVGEDELSGLVFEDTKTQKEVSFNCKAAFICIGQLPNNGDFKDLVDLDKNGYIISDEDCRTSQEGVFVAGDCRTKKIRQLVTAANDGSIAAFNCCQYLDTLK